MNSIKDYTGTEHGCVEITRGGGTEPVSVDAKASALYFTHEADPGDRAKAFYTLALKSVQRGLKRPDYPEVMAYHVDYADGSSLRIPVRWGEGIENGMRRTFEPVSRWLGDLAWATIAWKGDHDYDRDLTPVRYRMEWPNPYPEKEIARIRVESPEDDGTVVRIYSLEFDEAGRENRVYYVAPDGDDAADGSFEHPWATPGMAAATVRAGDTVYLRGGTYRIDDPVSPHHSGSGNAWITICGYPGETAILDGASIHTDRDDGAIEIHPGEDALTATTGTGVVHIYNRSYIRVKNLKVENAAYCGLGIDSLPARSHDIPDGFAGSHHIELLYNRIENTVAAGIAVYGESMHRKVTAEEAKMLRERGRPPGEYPPGGPYVVGEGISVNHVRVIGNLVLNTFDAETTLKTSDPGAQAAARRRYRERDGPLGKESLDIEHTRHFEVAFNEVGWAGKEGMDIMDGTRHGRVHHNYVHDNFTHEWFPGGKIGIYIDTRQDVSDVEFDHNVVERAGTGIRICNEIGSPGYQLKIHHNLVLDNRNLGIDVRGKGIFEEGIVHDIEVSNNTAYRNGIFARYGASGTGCGISLRGGRGLHDVVLRNNISAHNQGWSYALHRGVDRVEHRIRVDYNLSWPAVLQVVPAQPTNDHPLIGDLPVVADPLFIDPDNYNFGLRKGSPALNTGHPDTQNLDGTRSDLGAFPRPGRRPVIPYVENPPSIDEDVSKWEGIETGFRDHLTDPRSLRLCWNARGLYGAAVCRDADPGPPIDWLYHADTLLIGIQTDGERPRSISEKTFRWNIRVEDDGQAKIDQKPGRGMFRYHYWDQSEVPIAEGLWSAEPPEGARAVARRFPGGFQLAFYYPAELLSDAEWAAGLELPFYLCLTNRESRVVEIGERAEPTIERLWLSPSRWATLRLGD